MSYIGKIRTFVHYVGKDSPDPFEAAYTEVFDDTLISNVTAGNCNEVLRNERGYIEERYVNEDIEEILKDQYRAGDVVEILSDVHFEDTSGDTDCGWEYDFQMWLENIKHHKLTVEQIDRFCPVLGEQGGRDEQKD